VLLVLLGLDGVVVLEVSLGVGDTVEDTLNHDSLHDDAHHVEGDEEITGEGEVDPLPALVGAAEEVVVVDKDAAEVLDEELHDGDNNLVAHIDTHLFLEDGLHQGEVLGDLLESDLLSLSKGEEGFVRTFPLEPVVLLVDVVVVDRVDDEEDGSVVHAGRVELVGSALGAQSGEPGEGEHHHEDVKTVHDPPVCVSVLPELLSFGGGDVSQKDVHAQEVQVVGGVAHEEEREDELGAKIEGEEAAKDHDVEAENDRDQSELSIFSAVSDEAGDQEVGDQADLEHDEGQPKIKVGS